MEIDANKLIDELLERIKQLEKENAMYKVFVKETKEQQTDD